MNLGGWALSALFNSFFSADVNDKTKREVFLVLERQLTVMERECRIQKKTVERRKIKNRENISTIFQAKKSHFVLSQTEINR